MRLKANKTSLYNLVATYKPLPGMRRVDFQKANGRPDYWLEWTTDDGHTKAFLSSSLGHPILTITTHDAVGGQLYPLALAVAQTESNFDMDAVGASGEVGIMQLNPGPGGSYHAEIQAATGLDPTTASGNIAGGCYKLGLYLAKYGSVEKAAMAYNMGEGGAKNAWAGGITSTNYSRTVKGAMETWECTVNAWGGV